MMNKLLLLFCWLSAVSRVVLLVEAVEEPRDDQATASSYLWPVVDCRRLVRGEADPAADAAIGNALLTRGFFFAQHVLETPTGKEEDAASTVKLAEVYEASRRAHALPVEEKRKYSGAGYTGPDVEKHELSYEPHKKSIVRAWDFAREVNSFVPEHTDYPDNLQDIMHRLYDRQALIGKVLLRAMARGLAKEGLDEDAFSKLTANGELGSVRLLYYPALTEEEFEQENINGISAHTDFEAFTLMHQDAPGLQVRARHSKVWEDVPMRVVSNESNENTLLVIVGDVLERLTNGYLQATPHRVLPTTQHDRYAIIRFNALEANAVIAPLPPFCNETHPQGDYSPTTMAEIMRVVMKNLEAGKGAWDPVNDKSTTVDYDYSTSTSEAESCTSSLSSSS
eukprot:scaffold1123_cov168-Amphora_coffeaeformis.AAC.21